MTPGDVRFAAAMADDVPAIHRLVESAYRGTAARGGWTHEADLLGGQRTDRETLAQVIADPDNRILLAWQGQALLGCVQISRAGDQAAYLGLLSVDPAGQGLGLGKRLIAAAEAEAQRHFAATRIEMTVIRQRGELIAFYERRGYRPTGETRPFPYGDERFGIPQVDDLIFVVLDKPLKSPAA